jgi:hypothetical protein
MRKIGLSKGQRRQLEELEAASKVERFDSMDIVCIGLRNAEAVTLAARKEMPADQIGHWVLDWYVEADGRISNILRRFTFDPSDEGRNYLRDAMGKLSEDLGLERRSDRPGPGSILWVVGKRGKKRFPTKIGTQLIQYAEPG